MNLKVTDDGCVLERSRREMYRRAKGYVALELCCLALFWSGVMRTLQHETDGTNMKLGAYLFGVLLFVFCKTNKKREYADDIFEYASQFRLYKLLYCSCIHTHIHSAVLRGERFAFDALFTCCNACCV